MKHVEVVGKRESPQNEDQSDEDVPFWYQLVELLPVLNLLAEIAFIHKLK